MRGKIAKLIRKKIYGDDSPKGVEKIFKHKVTNQIIKDDQRRHYKKSKKRYHQTKIDMTQKESTRTLERARELLERKKRNRKRLETRKTLGKIRGVEERYE